MRRPRLKSRSQSRSRATSFAAAPVRPARSLTCPPPPSRPLARNLMPRPRSPFTSAGAAAWMSEFCAPTQSARASGSWRPMIIKLRIARRLVRGPRRPALNLEKILQLPPCSFPSSAQMGGAADVKPPPALTFEILIRARPGRNGRFILLGRRQDLRGLASVRARK